MSGAYPATPEFSTMKFSSWQPTLVSVSHSLARQARSRGGAQRWAIEGVYPSNLSRAELAPVFGFAIKQRGQYEIFTLTPPALWSTARGIHTGTPKVDAAGQTGRTVNTKGWTPSTVGILLTGDFVKFNGHSKVYMVTADVNADAFGLATVAIEPALMAVPADGAVITVRNVPFTLALGTDTMESAVAPGSIYNFSLQLVEAF